LEFERQVSRVFHENGLPVLVSSLFLRSLQAGQADLVRYFPRERVVELWEVKSGKSKISELQKRRLGQSLRLLSAIFRSRGKMSLCEEVKAFPNCQFKTSSLTL